LINPHPPLTAGPPIIVLLLVIVQLCTAIFPRISVLKRFTSQLLFCRYFLLSMLILITPLTYYSGFWGEEFAEDLAVANKIDLPKDVIEEHESLAKLFLISLVPLALFGFIRSEKRVVSALYCLFLLLSFGLVIATAHEGGELVFEHGAGVENR
jgi:uncharacterized membrane protein